MAHRVDTYLLDSSVYSDMTLLLDLHTACGLLTLARLHVHAISRSLHTYTRSHNVVQPRKQVHPLTVTGTSDAREHHALHAFLELGPLIGTPRPTIASARSLGGERGS